METEFIYTGEEPYAVEEIIWNGPGWYASRGEWGRMRTFKVGELNEEPEPETYTQGLGIPFKLEEKPE